MKRRLSPRLLATLGIVVAVFLLKNRAPIVLSPAYIAYWSVTFVTFLNSLEYIYKLPFSYFGFSEREHEHILDDGQWSATEYGIVDQCLLKFLSLRILENIELFYVLAICET